MIVLDGKKTAQDIQLEIAEKVERLKADGKKTPHLAAILVGGDGASLTYVNAKVKACERVGFELYFSSYGCSDIEDALLNKIDELKMMHSIDGFIVQLPLPNILTKQK